jgi:hypothetical protein
MGPHADSLSLDHQTSMLVDNRVGQCVLPLAFGAVAVAIAFSAANLVLIARRVAIENRALSPGLNAS